MNAEPARHPTAQKLLDAAIEQMDKTGEASIHIHDVLEASGVAYGSLYHHFGSREGLVSQAIVERYVRSVFTRLPVFAEKASKVTNQAELEELLRSELVRIDSAALRTQRLRRINAVGAAVHRPQVLAVIAEKQAFYFDVAASVIEDLKDRGLIDPSVPVRPFCAWYLSLILSRTFVDIDPGSDPTKEWSEFTFAATLLILRGGASEVG